jgi:hypothetical protein
VNTTIYPRNRTTRKLYRREPITEPGTRGYRSLPDGEEEIHYEVSMNIDALHSLARKAAGNKSQRCVDGPLTVRVLERKRIANAE